MAPKISLSYDALDRLVGATTFGEATVHSFYRCTHLSTELQGDKGFSIFRSAECLHAQHRIEQNQTFITLLATDLQRSVLLELEDARHRAFAYSAYGHRQQFHLMSSLLAFNGERANLATGHYLLGNGYRAYNPVLMRFNSPDKLSPFGRGGVNVFAYCKGDPTNLHDPSGQFFQAISQAFKVVQSALKISWKSYTLVLRPFGKGLGGAATLVSRAGYLTTAAGWGIRSSGFAVGQSITAVGGGLIAAGKVLKLTDKLTIVVKNGKFGDGLRNRLRQLRGKRAADADPERAGIRDD